MGVCLLEFEELATSLALKADLIQCFHHKPVDFSRVYRGSACRALLAFYQPGFQAASALEGVAFVTLKWVTHNKGTDLALEMFF